MDIFGIICVLILVLVLAIHYFGDSRVSGRTGVFVATFVGAGKWNKDSSYRITAEVEELSQSNGYSKIKVLSISGIEKYYHDHVKDLIGTLVKTDSVQWYSKTDA